MTDKTTIQKAEPDLYKRSIKGGYWVISSRVVLNVLGFLKSLFIVNFFLLNDLGLLSASVMMMEILSTFTQTGFDSALIQKKGDIRDYLDTAWTAGVVKGISLFLILYFAAPLFASFRIPDEKVPLAVAVFRAMSVCFLISGFRNIGVIYFSKNLDFHKTFVLSAASNLADIVLSVALVLVFRNIWGVIAARLLTAAIDSAGTYILSSYRPRLHFEPKKARELWTFGRWIFGGNIIGYLLEAGDDYFVWFYLGIQPLALYRTAYRFATAPATHITHVISQVSFPAYSKIQDDPPRLRDAYLKVLKVTALLSIPAAFLIFTLGPDFVKLFMKPHLHPMIPALQILAWVGLITSLGSTFGTLYTAIGKPHLGLYFVSVRLILLAIIIYPLTAIWGIVGTAFSVMLMRILIFPLGFLLGCRILKYRPWLIIKPLCVSVFASGVMCIAIMMLKRIIETRISVLQFFCYLLLAYILYFIFLWLLDFVFKLGYRKIVIEQINIITQKIRNG